MRLSDLNLRCYANKEKNKSWYAICIDLNLFAQGNDLEEVRTKLQRMIADYTAEAFAIDSNYFEDLIPRKASIYFMIRYYWLSLFRSNNAQLFTECLPVIPDF